MFPGSTSRTFHPQNQCLNPSFSSYFHKYHALNFNPPSPSTNDRPDTSERTLEKPYDWVVFLGGTNDIAYAKTPTEIFTTIRAIIAMPLEYGARILMMTIPECHAKSEALDERRDALNDMIKEEAKINDDV